MKRFSIDMIVLGGNFMLGNHQIFVANRSTINISLVVHYCGAEHCQPKVAWGPKVVDHYILYYVYEGQGSLYVNNKKYKLKKGHVFLVSPNTLMGYEADSKNPMKLAWVGFFGYQAEGYLQRCGLNVDHPISSIGADAYILKQFDEMIRVGKLSQNRYCRMLSSLYLIVSHLIDLKEKDQNNIPLEATTELYLRKALDYADMNYGSFMTVQEMSEYVGIDRKYLYHIFRSKLGKSPQKYLIDYRIEKATELLKDPTLTVADVARSVGYNNAFHFSKLFKKLIGEAPSDYRKRHQIQEEKSVESESFQELKAVIEEKDKVIDTLKEVIENYKLMLKRSPEDE